MNDLTRAQSTPPPVPSAATIEALVAENVGDVRARAACRALRLPDGPGLPQVSRAEIALALAAILFDDVQRRVPMARAYVEDAVQEGRRLTFDHGAIRTVAAPSGALPAGAAAFARILEPLGYERADSYDLSRIGMTGHAYLHADLPEDIPQYFVSELHPERFSEPFRAAVERTLASGVDPLSRRAQDALATLRRRGGLARAAAATLVGDLARCFDRHHDTPTALDYEALLAESAEMAWIATEGSAFNHATDRVDDVFAVADAQRALGRPIKDAVEVSRNGNVMQTAFRAVRREALLRGPDGHMVVREVPGSFHEFITRKRLVDGSLDLSFDAGNATSIFGMTSAGASRESA